MTDEPMSTRENLYVLGITLVGVGVLIASVYLIGAFLLLTVGRI